MAIIPDMTIFYFNVFYFIYSLYILLTLPPLHHPLPQPALSLIPYLKLVTEIYFLLLRLRLTTEVQLAKY